MMAAHNAAKACSPKTSTGVEICFEHTAIVDWMRNESQLQQSLMAEAEVIRGSAAGIRKFPALKRRSDFSLTAAKQTCRRQNDAEQADVRGIHAKV